MTERSETADDFLAQALDWERQHRKRGHWNHPAGLDDPIEKTNTEHDPDEPMVIDLPGELDLLPDPSQLATFQPSQANWEELSMVSSLAQAEGADRRSQRGLPAGLNPHDLSQTGWGVITPRGLTDAYLDLLAPLIERRREQAGALFRDDIYYEGESPEEFLWDTLRLSPGIIDPAQLPYYLLLVGGPELIPFEIQYALSINRSVGRIAFDEDCEEDWKDYRRWAQAVVDAEEKGVDRPRRATILGVEDGGRATRTLASHLVEPITQRLEDFVQGWPEAYSWEFETLRREEAGKAAFLRTLGGESTPGLALVAAHGLYLDSKNPHQRAFQGAICCHRAKDTETRDSIFHAGDLASKADYGPLHGLIAFLFSCYGAGTPREDDFPQHTPQGIVIDPLPQPRPLTEKAFVAALPQAMLRNGALAVVGHIDRGWTLSFAWTLAGRYTDAVRSLEDSLKQLLRGHRVGHALRALHRRYSEIAAHLTHPLDRLRLGREIDPTLLGLEWTALHDARNFILLGDPAVYLRGSRDESRPFCCDLWTAPSDSNHRTRRPFENDLSLSPELLQAVRTQAQGTGLNPRDWIEAVVRQHLAKNLRNEGGPS